MKNNISYNIKIFFGLIILFFIPINTFSDEFDITATKIKIIEGGEKIFAEGNVVANSKDNLTITAEKIIYDKKNNTLKAQNSVLLNDKKTNSQIKSNEITYNQNEQKIKSYGKTIITFKNNFDVETSDIIFDRNKKTIESKKLTTGLDKNGNKLSLNNFIYHTQNYTLRSQGEIHLIDNLNNNYFFKEIFVNTKNDKFAGSDIKVKFNKNTFNNTENDPRLVANNAIIQKNKSILSKGIFTTCKKDGDKCPPWQMGAEKIIHDKDRKIIYYEKAWLKVYDIPVMYFPRFFHPDPTVKRQSGFLQPTISNSSTIGAGINLPYYFALADHKDLTIKPKIYFNENSVLQTEYRHLTKNSKTIIDSSFHQGYKSPTATKTDGSRNHFFLNSKLNLDLDIFDESTGQINIQRTSNDTYLRVHNLKSELIKDTTLLSSNVELNLFKDDTSLDINFAAYENLNKDTDKFEFIAPSLDYNSNLFYSEKYGDFNFKSSSYHKIFNTNIKETFLINDFLWKSNNFISNSGLVSSFEGNIKNINYETTKSTTHKNDNVEVSPVVAFKSSYPLRKENQESDKILSPMLMLRYAPISMNDLSDSQLKLNTENLFTLNKLDNLNIESGANLTLGLDYSKYDKVKNLNKLEASFGQVYRLSKNSKMPIQSSLGQKTSELVGKALYNFNQESNISYKYSLDHNFNDLNYSEISSNFRVNNIVTNFDYLKEKNNIGKNNYLNAGIKLELDTSNSLSFKTRKNYLTDTTEFYNLQYLYENDCLKAGIEFNRSFYTDKDLEPENNFMLTLTIIPFGKVSTPAIEAN